jgi:phage protein D
MWLPGAGKDWGMATRFINSQTGDVEDIYANDATEAPPRPEGKGGPEASKEHPGADKETGNGMDQVSADAVDQPFIKTQMNTEFNAAIQSMGIRVEVGSVGIPDLMPGECIELAGLGNKISGAGNRYYVQSVNHVWGSSGTNTSFAAVSNSDRLLKWGYESTGPKGTKEGDFSSGSQAEAKSGG